jgi:hypothetical protein
VGTSEERLIRQGLRIKPPADPLPGPEPRAAPLVTNSHANRYFRTEPEFCRPVSFRQRPRFENISNHRPQEGGTHYFYTFGRMKTMSNEFDDNHRIFLYTLWGGLSLLAATIFAFLPADEAPPFKPAESVAAPPATHAPDPKAARDSALPEPGTKDHSGSAERHRMMEAKTENLEAVP